MGEVYKGRDMRLDRPVAIKVLPADAAGHLERRRRFVHEAKAASALNHPNIVHVYAIETTEDVAFMAMEFVDGRTLGELLGRKGLPIRDTLKYAAQIADGLAAAHAAGVVHRDIKPGNVMVTPHGLVKILDFGLAKLTEATESDPDGLTRTLQPVTEAGTIVGTVAYMSPEQAEGLPVDARSDIFAFGSVLYEMATGVRPFQGQTKLSTLSAILHQEPRAPSEISPALPRELERIISLCLRKDPRHRLQHMDDVKALLETLKEESESGRLSNPGPASATPARRQGWWVALACGVTMATGAGIAAWWTSSAQRAAPGLTPKPMMRLTSDTGLTTTPALSPDGKLVAYASDRAGADNLDIWVQQISGGAPLRLTSDTANEFEPTFSPDGSRIVYRSERDGGGLYTISTLGGEPRLIAKGGRNPSFSPDGSRVAFVTGVGGPGGTTASAALFAVSSMGGTPQKLVSADIGAANPIWSPDGQFILFATGVYGIDGWAIAPSRMAEAVSNSHALMVLALDPLKTVGLADASPRQWLPGNRVVFSAKLGDAAHVFEIGLSAPTWFNRQWHLRTSPTRLTFGTSQEDSPSLASALSAARTRRLAFASLSRSENIWGLTIDPDHPRPDGTLEPLTREMGFQIFPSASQNGAKLAFLSHTAYNDEVWVQDTKTGKRSLLSTAVSLKLKPIVDGDGSRVFYESDETGRGAIYAVSSAGGTPEQICERCGWPWEISADHTRLLSFSQQGQGPVGAAMHDLKTRKRSVFLERPGMDLYQFHWSPDSRWITFFASIEGKTKTIVYVAPFIGDRGPDERAWIQITSDATMDSRPRWSPDGNWLYTLSDRDGYTCVWATPLDGRTKRPAGQPVAVFHSHGVRRSLRNANYVTQELSVTRDKIVFGLGEITGNIWMTELEE